MQFKHPEILFFLFLLLIPLLIHLFQLQRFKKEAFTNVKFLKKIELETRKSAKLKKLLILISRMLAFAGLIIAFSQPFINKNQELQKRESVIYLDNSMSLQAKGASGIEQFQQSKNILLDQYASTDMEINFMSNAKLLNELDPKSLNNELISLGFHPTKKDINQVLLQINNQFSNKTNTLADIYLISDFQVINNKIDTSLLNPYYQYNIINLSNEKTENISLDSLWMSHNSDRQISLKASLSSWNMTLDDLSVSLFLNDELYGKTTVSLIPGSKEEIEFLIPEGKTTTGKISINDHRLNFDNELYFNIPQLHRKNILVIGKQSPFLQRIYQKNEFNLINVDYQELDQSSIPTQDLIIINELEKISKPLAQSLIKYVKQQGNLVIIPASQIDLNSYNQLLQSMKAGRITDHFEVGKTMTRINYDHPFFNKVFEKEIYNFQYPVLSNGYIGYFNNAAPLLQFDDRTDFITEIQYFENKVFWIASSLSDQGNNFVSSPLIVPIFYNFSIQSSNDAALYVEIGRRNEINVHGQNLGDSPVKISNEQTEFIPMQTKSSETITVTTEEFPLNQGIYNIQINNQVIQKHAFNYDRTESILNYNDLVPLAAYFENVHMYTSLNKALKEGNQRNLNQDLWQLFIIFALVFLILEILLQKFLKN